VKQSSIPVLSSFNLLNRRCLADDEVSSSYDAFFRHHPDCTGIKALNSKLSGRSSSFAQVLTHTGSLKAIQEQVRFARARFGHYDLLDFVAVLIGYVLSGEPTLLAFYERLAPFASPFMALFGRNRLLPCSMCSRLAWL